MKPSALRIVTADLGRAAHRRAVLDLTDAYARDPMGDHRPLPASTRRHLLRRLRRHPTTLILLAFRGRQPAGIATCFRGFSTFAARPLLNLHDLAVHPDHRGQGIGRRLLAAVEKKARALGCCKLTLEVLEHNHSARALYAQVGFQGPVYQGRACSTLFLSKPL